LVRPRRTWSIACLTRSKSACGVEALSVATSGAGGSAATRVPGDAPEAGAACRASTGAVAAAAGVITAKFEVGRMFTGPSRCPDGGLGADASAMPGRARGVGRLVVTTALVGFGSALAGLVAAVFFAAVALADLALSDLALSDFALSDFRSADLA